MGGARFISALAAASSGDGAVRECERHADVRITVDNDVSRNFGVREETDLNLRCGGFSDLLFYDSAAGRGNSYLHDPPQSTPVAPLAGYRSKGSVRPGE